MLALLYYQIKVVIKIIDPNPPHFGEIFYADLPVEGSVQGGVRPVLVVQNDIGNKHAPTVEIIPFSSRIYKANRMPTHVFVPHGVGGLTRDSILLAENVRTIPKDLLLSPVGLVDEDVLRAVGAARAIQSPLPYLR